MARWVMPGYALALICVCVYAPVPSFMQSAVFDALTPVVQSHAWANCGWLQSFGVWRGKMQANCRSSLGVRPTHSRPLMGSQLSAPVAGRIEEFDAWARPGAQLLSAEPDMHPAPMVRGTMDSSMWKSAPVKS